MARMSQCDKTLQLISRPGGATGMDIIRAGVLNYRGRICDLRKRGYAIRTTMTDGVNAVGEPCEYAVYSLEKATDRTPYCPNCGADMREEN